MELSKGMVDPGRPIMGSQFIDMFMHPASTILLGIALVALIGKEFLLKNIRERALINVTFLFVLMMLNGVLIANYSAPIQQLGVTHQGR